MRTIATIMSVGTCVIAVLTAAGCGTTSSPTQTPTTTTPPAQSAPAQPAPAPATDIPANGQPAQQWTMPNLVGTVLQDAQDQIQTLTGDGVYFTGSHDLSGKNRSQVLDANWQVCTQNIAPGAALTSTSRINFGVVKLAESCP